MWCPLLGESFNRGSTVSTNTRTSKREYVDMSCTNHLHYVRVRKRVI